LLAVDLEKLQSKTITEQAPSGWSASQECQFQPAYRVVNIARKSGARVVKIARMILIR